MAKDKKSVLLYCDIIHTVEGLTDEEAGRLFKHYLRYINDLDPVSEDRLTTLLFEPIKQNLKRDLKKWEAKSERNSNIAKEGWKKRREANASERIKTDANNADKDTVKVKDKVIVKDKDIKDIILTSDFWIEQVAKKKNLTVVKVRDYLKDFLDDLELKVDLDKGEKQIKSHFINWVSIELKKEKEVGGKTTGSEDWRKLIGQ